MTEDVALEFRDARREDLDAIVAMLADDALGRTRERAESPLPDSYHRAFDAIRQSDNDLVVACHGKRVVAVLQITYTPHLSYQGGWRATIEGVRTDSALRGRGIGRAIVGHAIERARARGCHVVQLTSDKSRTDARRFYERLGFTATHEGMKLHLE